MCPAENKGEKQASRVGEWKKERNFYKSFQPSGNGVRLAEVKLALQHHALKNIPFSGIGLTPYYNGHTRVVR